jgi:hypothetical protein
MRGIQGHAAHRTETAPDARPPGGDRRIGPPIPHSLRITGTVEEWETWTRMQFPDTGDYVFPAGLATVHIDREAGTGEYWEPNIWIIHEARGGPPR